MSKSSNTVYALVVKGNSKTALAVGSGEDVQATIQAGVMPGVWARQATLLEAQTCYTLQEWVQARLAQALFEQAHPLPTQPLFPDLDGEHLTNLHDLQEQKDKYLQGYSWDTEVRAGYISSPEFVEAAADVGDPIAVAALADVAAVEAFAADIRGTVFKIGRATRAMIERVKALANLSAGEDQI